MVCSLAGHFQTSSIGAKWSFLITFIFLLKLQEKHKKAPQCWGDSHVSGSYSPGSYSPGNPSLALWLLSVDGIRV